MSDSPPGISAAPNEENLRHFDVSVSGPESSPYEGTSLLPRVMGGYRDMKADQARWCIQARVVSTGGIPYEPT